MLAVTPEAVAAARFVAVVDALVGLLSLAADDQPDLVSVRVEARFAASGDAVRVVAEFVDSSGAAVGGFEL